jgi:ABC-type dipeptide/oligopeptide/nickel transport system permease component
VLLEAIFAWPGLGLYALQAIERSDFAALQGFVIYASLLYVVAFLVVDVLYMLIDPRIRT